MKPTSRENEFDAEVLRHIEKQFKNLGLSFTACLKSYS